MRDIRIFVESSRRAETIGVPPALEGIATQIAWCPCDHLLRTFAEGIVAAEQGDGELFTQVTIEVRRAVQKVVRITLAVTTLLGFVADALAQTVAPPQDATSLAKATQNPVGDLTSLPFQFNFSGGGDLKDQTLLTVNFQPVIPFRATERWSVIARTIVPIESVPAESGMRFSGVGDIQAQLFITPGRPGRVIWGLGPQFSFPTATAAPLQTGTWAFGPCAVVLTMAGHWVGGALIQQVWPIADAKGTVDRKTDQFVLQPFVNYNFGRGWAVSVAPSISANWDAASGQQWTVPFGMGVSRVAALDHRPMSIGVQYYYNVARPDGAAAYTLRLAVSLLYPRR